MPGRGRSGQTEERLGAVDGCGKQATTIVRVSEEVRGGFSA